MGEAKVKIGDFEIGRGRTFVIAEAGINHNGDVDRAHTLIDAAVAVGADAVKFQTFRADELGSPHLARYELPATAWPDLAAHAAQRRILFFSTPFDVESVDLLDPLVPCFKIASGEIVNLPLLRHVASKGKPVILSTGMATLDEILAAEMALYTPGDSQINDGLIALHCVSAYPAPVTETNLRAMQSLVGLFGRSHVGLSDHSLSAVIPAAAVALGAVVIEKHLTLDTKLDGPDHAMSLDVPRFAEMVRNIREVESALGDGVKRVMPSEEETKRRARRDPSTGRRPS